MVGIYAKIKNGLSWLKNKVKDNVLPTLGKIGDFANSKAVHGILGLATPALNSFMPWLGTGLSTAANFVGKLGSMSNDINDHLNNGDLMDYASEKAQQIFGMANPNAKPKLTVSRGIGLARRPDKLSSRIQLKSLPAPDDLPRGPIIEELD
jgi:hypothetical protein